MTGERIGESDGKTGTRMRLTKRQKELAVMP